MESNKSPHSNAAGAVPTIPPRGSDGREGTPVKQLEGARFTGSASFRQTANQSSVSMGGGGVLPVTSALKDLKNNYQQIESTIVENTKRQR